MKRITFLLVSVLLVACSNQSETSDASGSFEATEIVVSAEANGKLLELNFEEGQVVNDGELLGKIDSTQLYLKRLQLLSNVSAVGKRRLDVNKQIAAIEEQIATQKRERQRVERLIAAKSGNQKQLDDINASIAVLEKQLAAQKSSIENTNASITDERSAMELQVAQLDDQLAKTRIVSPTSGTVLAKYAEAGELTAAGRPICKIADLSKMFLRAYITSAQLTQINLGQQVTVSTDFGETESRQYTGQIIWISDKSEFTPKTIQTKDERANLVYAIKIAVANDGYLKIGMYADVIFTE